MAKMSTAGTYSAEEYLPQVLNLKWPKVPETELPSEMYWCSPVQVHGYSRVFDMTGLAYSKRQVTFVPAKRRILRRKDHTITVRIKNHTYSIEYYSLPSRL
jgi:hypothetical protein